MSKLDNVVEQLIQAVLESQEYHEYDLQRNKVKQNPELKAKIDEFRKKNYEMQTSEDNGFDKLEQLEREYGDLFQESVVSDFLDAELAFCRVIQEINHRLTEAVHFE